MFKPDKPIESSKEDILGRQHFAHSLADAIISYREKDSIAIGLFGAWGSGKTSIINMALEHIESTSMSIPDEHKPIVIMFNPWNFSDQNQLITQFFRQLSTTLRRPEYAEDIKKAGEMLEIYAKFFEPLGWIPAVGPTAANFSKLLGKIGSAAKSWGDLKSNDLNAIRGELEELLGKQSHRIIVVADDIDRCNNTEIRQIFQLIKSLGDFPNMIYLVAFDKEVVVRALEDVQGNRGLNYLEKVVQVPFEVPLISRQDVEQLLLDEIGELIKDIPDEKWDRIHWGNIYHDGLKYFFRTIRDVRRYINSLRFSLQMVREEVNICDFLAITGIQVFIPDVYQAIRDNKDIFSGIFYQSNDAERSQAKIRCEEIIGRADESLQDILRNLLTRLFPKLEYVYGNRTYGYDSQKKWRREGRVCSPDIFDTFFKLSIPRGEISQNEIKTILSLSEDPDSFAEALLSLNEDRRIVKFLERFEDYTESIPKEHIEPIITVLMDIGDLFPEGPIGSRMRSSDNVSFLFDRLIHRFNTHEERFIILRNAIEKARGSIQTIVDTLVTLGSEHGKYNSRNAIEPEENRIIDRKELDELERLVHKKVKEWAEDGRLLMHRRLPFILFVWAEMGNQEDVNEFVKRSVKCDDGLVDFIAAFVGEYITQVMTDRVGTVREEIYLDSIEKYVEIQEIEPRIREIFSSPSFEKLDNKKKRAITVFINTVEQKKRANQER